MIRRVCYQFAPRASGLYQAPTIEELLHLDRHVFKPLFNLTITSAEAEWNVIRAAASVYGYEVTGLRRGNDSFVLLYEPDQRRYWGSVLVRVSDLDENAAGMCFEVPSRVRDHSILSFASSQFRRFGAKALIVAGTNTLTNPDATSKLTVASNRDSFFNLAHQAYCRSRSGRDTPPPLVIQCRAYLPPLGEKYPEGDLIVSPYFGNFPAESIGAALTPLRDKLREEGVDIASMTYDDATSPYAPGFNIQARYMDFTYRGTFALFWISPFLRENYELQEENHPLHKLLKAVEIPIFEIPLREWLADDSFVEPGPQQEQYKAQLCAFREKHDIEILRALTLDPGMELKAILDPASSQLFLSLVSVNGGIHLVSNLSRNAPVRSIEAGLSSVKTFVDSRAAWMEKISKDTTR